MRELLLGGGTGLVLGMAVQRMGLTSRLRLRQTAALRDRQALRVLLLALGLCAMLVSLLMWLAVIDVDNVRVAPLHGGTVLGGMLFGAVVGWTGQTPGSAAAGLGGDRLLEGACGVAGCLAGAALLPVLQGVFAPVRALLPNSDLTWFRVTLDRPFLFSGGFLGQGCAGLLLIALALCIRREQPAPVPEEKPALPPVSDAPQDVREDTVVATLPGEEPVVVDMAQDAPVPEHDSPAVPEPAPPDPPDAGDAEPPREEPQSPASDDADPPSAPIPPKPPAAAPAPPARKAPGKKKKAKKASP